MESLLAILALASSYFVEWIPNNATTSSTNSSPGEFPWQLSGG